MKASIQPLSKEDIANILNVAFPAFANTTFEFSPLEEGAINLVYRIDVTGTQFPTPLALKVIAKRWGIEKLQNEVLVMQFLYENLSIPLHQILPNSQPLIPKIHKHEYGAERSYILMDFMEGVTLKMAKIPQGKKEFFYKQFAAFYAAVKSFSFREPCFIGHFKSLSLVSPSELLVNASMELGDMESMVPPARSYKEWVVGCLQYRISGIEKLKHTAPQPYGRALNILEELLKVINEQGVLDDLTWDSDNRLSLHHGDFNYVNMLVDPNTFELKGVIDWEWAGTHFLESDFDNFDLGDFDNDLFSSSADFYWRELALKFPQARKGTLFPDATDTKAKRRRFWHQVIYFALSIMLLCNWKPSSWLEEIDDYVKNGEFLLAGLPSILSLSKS